MEQKKRLIDANELTDRLNHTTMVAYPNLFPGLLAAVEIVDDSPTVDAVEVVHGEWTVIEDDWNEETIYQCSNCKEEFVTIDGTPAENLWNYCPNCGAKMDGEEGRRDAEKE